MKFGSDMFKHKNSTTIGSTRFCTCHTFQPIRFTDLWQDAQPLDRRQMTWRPNRLIWPQLQPQRNQVRLCPHRRQQMRNEQHTSPKEPRKKSKQSKEKSKERKEMEESKQTQQTEQNNTSPSSVNQQKQLPQLRLAQHRRKMSSQRATKRTTLFSICSTSFNPHVPYSPLFRIIYDMWLTYV